MFINIYVNRYLIPKLQVLLKPKFFGLKILQNEIDTGLITKRAKE